MTVYETFTTESEGVWVKDPYHKYYGCRADILIVKENNEYVCLVRDENIVLNGDQLTTSLF